MTYQVLARKWRPKTFSEVVGQEHVITALVNGLLLGRIHHAYLFSGTRGVGKTSIARLLAKGLSCETGITAAPCCKCSTCREIEQGHFVDLIEIDAASRTKVEDIRYLLDNIQYTPVRGRFKVYLIDEIHMLSQHSFNALLKTLEEPPSHVKFLLATTDPKKIPVTIISRCLRFHLKVLGEEKISAQLEQILNSEKIAYEPPALCMLARAAEGSLRDALTLTDQALVSGSGKLMTQIVSTMLGTLDNDQVLSIIEAVIDSNGERVFSLLKTLASNGIEWELLLVEMLTFLHHLAVMQLFPSIPVKTDRNPIIEQRLRKLSEKISPTDIQLYYQILLIGRKELQFSPDRQMGIEMTLLRALAFHPRTPFSEPEGWDQSFFQNLSRSHSSSSEKREMSVKQSTTSLSNSISLVLSARDHLQQTKGIMQSKKSEQSEVTKSKATIRNSLSSRIDEAKEPLKVQSNLSDLQKDVLLEKEDDSFQLKNSNGEVAIKLNTEEEVVQKVTQKERNMPIEEEKLFEEIIKRDAWAAEVSQLNLPKLVEQIALNSWKEQTGTQILLHLRSSHRHLNSPDAQKILVQELSSTQGDSIKLTIVEDDDPKVRTPLEWCKVVYEEKLKKAREAIVADNTLKGLCQVFDANLDEESIRPI